MPQHGHLVERVEKDTKKSAIEKIAEAVEVIRSEAKNLPFQEAMDICSAVMDIQQAIAKKEPTD